MYISRCSCISSFPFPACEDALGMENLDIPNYALLTTTPSYDAIRTRLNKPDYFLLQPQVDEYVQVDLGPGGKTLTAVTIKGRFSSSNKNWITKFALNYSRDGSDFFSYMENGVLKVKKGLERNQETLPSLIGERIHSKKLSISLRKTIYQHTKNR